MEREIQFTAASPNCNKGKSSIFITHTQRGSNQNTESLPNSYNQGIQGRSQIQMLQSLCILLFTVQLLQSSIIEVSTFSNLAPIVQQQVHAVDTTIHLNVHCYTQYPHLCSPPVQLMRPGVSQNKSHAVGHLPTSRPEGVVGLDSIIAILS